MVKQQLNEIINKNGKVLFRLFGVCYTIEKIDNSYYIYQTYNNLRQKKYTSLDDMFNSYTIYNKLILSFGFITYFINYKIKRI